MKDDEIDDIVENGKNIIISYVNEKLIIATEIKSYEEVLDMLKAAAKSIEEKISGSSEGKTLQ